jgi:hypothetical protein
MTAKKYIFAMSFLALLAFSLFIPAKATATCLYKASTVKFFNKATITVVDEPGFADGVYNCQYSKKFGDGMFLYACENSIQFMWDWTVSSGDLYKDDKTEIARCYPNRD